VDGVRDISIFPEPPSVPETIAQIDQLPPEMLVAIFTHLSKQERDPPGHKALHFVQDLVSVTHVCRSWRQVAIAAPELWTEITMANPDAVKAFLERSGAVPLNVGLRLGSGAKFDQDLLDAVIPHVHRLRQLALLTRQGLDPVRSMPFTEPAPLLERLAIYYPLGDRPALLFNDQAPRLREINMYSNGLWLKNQLWNLTSLHVTLSHVRRIRSDLGPFFDMLCRCPALEEMFVLWGGWGAQLESPQFPTVPLHRLRRLLLRGFRVGDVTSFLHNFDLKTNGIAIHLSGVYPGQGNSVISDIQSIFPNDGSGRPSLVSSTKLELIFHRRPRTMIMHTIGPGFSTRMDLSLEDFSGGGVVFTFHDVFRSVKELWVRGSPHVDVKFGGVEHLAALEKLVLLERGSVTAQSLRQELYPTPSGVLPCPLLSTVDFHGDMLDVDRLYHLLRSRSRVGSRLEKVRVPSRFATLPTSIVPYVREVGSLDIPSSALHMYSMELPEFCFAEDHKWWDPWRSRLN